MLYSVTQGGWSKNKIFVLNNMWTTPIATHRDSSFSHSKTWRPKNATKSWWQARQECLYPDASIYRHMYPDRPIQCNSSMHHYECVALCKDINVQRGRFCTRSLASRIPRSSEGRSSWMFFIQVVRGHPGRLQFSGGGSKMAWLASAFSSIRARCPKWDDGT